MRFHLLPWKGETYIVRCSTTTDPRLTPRPLTNPHKPYFASLTSAHHSSHTNTAQRTTNLFSHPNTNTTNHPPTWHTYLPGFLLSICIYHQLAYCRLLPVACKSLWHMEMAAAGTASTANCAVEWTVRTILDLCHMHHQHHCHANHCHKQGKSTPHPSLCKTHQQRSKTPTQDRGDRNVATAYETACARHTIQPDSHPPHTGNVTPPRGPQRMDMSFISFIVTRRTRRTHDGRDRFV